MGPTTRTRSSNNIIAFDNKFEIITDTLDPIQKTITTCPQYLPFWRYALFQRYAGSYTPKDIKGDWTNFSIPHKRLPTHPITQCESIPEDLYKSVVRITRERGGGKLLTVTVFYTTATLLIQGTACQRWVDEEFESLRAVVHTLASTTASPHCLTLADTQHPGTDTSRALMSAVPSLSSADELTALTAARTTRRSAARRSSSLPRRLVPLPPTDGTGPTVHTTTATPPCSSLPLADNAAGDEVILPRQLAMPQEVDGIIPPAPVVPAPSLPASLPASPIANKAAEEVDDVTPTAVVRSPGPLPPSPPVSPTLVLGPPDALFSSVISLVASPLHSHLGTPVILLSPSYPISLPSSLRPSLVITEVPSEDSPSSSSVAPPLPSPAEHNTNNAAPPSAPLPGCQESVAASSQTDPCCCHQDCVPASALADLKDSMEAEINALRSELRRLNSHCKIEFDAINTQLSSDSKRQPKSKPSNKTTKSSMKTTTPPSPPSSNEVIPTSTSTPTPDVPPSPASDALPIYRPVPAPRRLPPRTLPSHHASSAPSQPPVPASGHNVASSTPATTTTQTTSLSPAPTRTNEEEWPSLVVRSGTSTLLIGDSVFRGLHENRMAEESEMCQVLSVSGLDRKGLVTRLHGTEPHTGVTRVVVHVGVNDCKRGVVLGKGAWRSVYRAVKRTFPNARLSMSSILPYGERNIHIRQVTASSNNNMRVVCQQQEMVFIDHDTSFFTRSGQVKTDWLVDPLHPNGKGTHAIAVDIKRSYSNPGPTKTTAAPTLLSSGRPLQARSQTITPATRPPLLTTPSFPAPQPLFNLSQNTLPSSQPTSLPLLTTPSFPAPQPLHNLPHNTLPCSQPMHRQLPPPHQYSAVVKGQTSVSPDPRPRPMPPTPASVPNHSPAPWHRLPGDTPLDLSKAGLPQLTKPQIVQLLSSLLT